VLVAEKEKPQGKAQAGGREVKHEVGESNVQEAFF